MVPEFKIVSGPSSPDFHDITAPRKKRKTHLSACDASDIILHHHLVLILNEKQIILINIWGVKSDVG